MDNSTFLLSDEALSKLVFESQVTMPSAKISRNDVSNRVHKFGQLYAKVAAQPEGVALLCQETENAAVHWRQFGEKLVVGRLSKSTRNPDGCDLAFQDDELSRRHFEIALVDDFYILRDLDSRNGTYVNDDSKKIHEHMLKAGDFIFAGHILFAFTGR